MLNEFLTRLRFLIAGRSHGEVDDEVRFHLDQQTEANIRAGMSPEEARRQALIEFGGVERTREQCREERPGYWLETFVQDLRYAVRGFRRNPTFSLTVVVTLMLGIGSTTAVFSVVDRILFRSLPYGGSSRLVSVGLVAPIEPQEFMLGGSYYEWQDHQKPFTALTSEIGVEPCDLTESNPARLVRLRTENNARLRFLSRDEYKKVLVIIARDNPDQVPAFVVSIYTGMRWGEQFSLRWEQVDL